ncbi:MAG: hypothetical protein H6739_00830 [Alphaproteobacteria bacterium]|nr:hypothetical protein [Alphaproteobacteria bacterium]
MTRPVLILASLAALACNPDGSSTDIPAGPGIEEILVESDPAARLYLTDAGVVDDDGDGGWSAGEGAALTVTLHEGWGEDYMNYPGVAVSASPDVIAWGLEENWFYGIFGYESYEMTFDGILDEDVAPDTMVEITVAVTSLGCPGDCPDPNPLVFTILSE